MIRFISSPRTAKSHPHHSSCLSNHNIATNYDHASLYTSIHHTNQHTHAYFHLPRSSLSSIFDIPSPNPTENKMCQRIRTTLNCQDCRVHIRPPTYEDVPCQEVRRAGKTLGRCDTGIVQTDRALSDACKACLEAHQKKIESKDDWIDEYKNGGNYTW